MAGGLFLATEPRRRVPASAYLDLQTGSLAAFGPLGADVEELALSRDGRTLAMITNERGVGVLRLFRCGHARRARAAPSADRHGVRRAMASPIRARWPST